MNIFTLFTMLINFLKVCMWEFLYSYIKALKALTCIEIIFTFWSNAIWINNEKTQLIQFFESFTDAPAPVTDVPLGQVCNAIAAFRNGVGCIGRTEIFHFWVWTPLPTYNWKKSVTLILVYPPHPNLPSCQQHHVSCWLHHTLCQPHHASALLLKIT